MKFFDHFFEKATRGVAQRSSRRGLLKTLGGGLVGGAMIPLLPCFVERTFGALFAVSSTGSALCKLAISVNDGL